MRTLSTLIDAYEFAAVMHRDQTRKDARRTPYINHPIEVAGILNKVAGIEDVEILSAAVLHDVIEDTGATHGELCERFGVRVADLVAECSDDKALPKAERKRLQIENAPHKSSAAKLIKLADKITNVRDILCCEWPADRKREYLDWAQKVVQGLRGQCPSLDALFDDVLRQARARLMNSDRGD